MARHYFLIKSEPDKYAWSDLCRDGKTHWDGVRNFEARNNLRAMQPGDLLLYYHSNEGKEIVGVAEVACAAYPDPTAPGEDWSVVDVKPLCPVSHPVSLDAIRKEPRLANMDLLRKSRLSVVPVSAAEFEVILKLGGTELPSSGAKRGAAKGTRSPSAKPTKSTAKGGRSQARTARAPSPGRGSPARGARIPAST
jgi:predicted RNA-binding protein with PUA-like domain